MFKRNPRKTKFRKGRSALGRRNGIADWWSIWRVPILLAIVSAGWWFLYRPYIAEQGWERVSYRFAICGEPWSGAQGCVVDGDTVIIGNGPSRRRIRLTGFDAPEIDGDCAEERKRAAEAKRELHTWLARGPFEWTGESAPPRDQYGRELREISRVSPNGKRVLLSKYMIDRQLASESGWGSMATQWCQ
ncbi:hypothetical protein FGU71_04190 [Erythrobacter insulae]|uniref:Thermonuclease family protein n=1 Tax=Erythrobacter insulae TaxID=2584124 RepID=A0A547PAF9_9SPHN|nr:hypothetical protein [Erythrobacter insulae]TRD11128.1 hypothetical protein FGU71_04190 [Erythrobacter insulae]